jgi:hypothetical protein
MNSIISPYPYHANGVRRVLRPSASEGVLLPSASEAVLLPSTARQSCARSASFRAAVAPCDGERRPRPSGN